MGRADVVRLRDIADAVHQIRVFRTRLRTSDADVDVVRSAILYHLVIIGEAARGMTAETRQAIPAVPWSDLVALRNVLTHEYFNVSVTRIEELLDRHLDALDAALRGSLM